MIELTTGVESEQDKDMVELMAKEITELTDTKEKLFEAIMEELVPEESDDITDIIMEIHAGAGGLEAGLFAYELYNMYQRFVDCSLSSKE